MLAGPKGREVGESGEPDKAVRKGEGKLGVLSTSSPCPWRRRTRKTRCVRRGAHVLLGGGVGPDRLRAAEGHPGCARVRHPRPHPVLGERPSGAAHPMLRCQVGHPELLALCYDARWATRSCSPNATSPGGLPGDAYLVLRCQVGHPELLNLCYDARWATRRCLPNASMPGGPPEDAYPMLRCQVGHPEMLALCYDARWATWSCSPNATMPGGLPGDACPMLRCQVGHPEMPTQCYDARWATRRCSPNATTPGGTPRATWT
eukprot:1196048-Prorocentrum_minimum.AAC.6